MLSWASKLGTRTEIIHICDRNVFCNLFLSICTYAPACLYFASGLQAVVISRGAQEVESPLFKILVHFGAAPPNNFCFNLTFQSALALLQCFVLHCYGEFPHCYMAIEIFLNWWLNYLI